MSSSNSDQLLHQQVTKLVPDTCGGAGCGDPHCDDDVVAQYLKSLGEKDTSHAYPPPAASETATMELFNPNITSSEATDKTASQQRTEATSSAGEQSSSQGSTQDPQSAGTQGELERYFGGLAKNGGLGSSLMNGGGRGH